MQRYKSTYTGPQIDEAIERALPGGEIEASLDSKMEIGFLDNTDFTNPVAQAGIGGNHGSVPFAVDRWELISGTVSGSANGLTLNGTIRQVRENSIGFPVIPSIEMYSGTATITYDDVTKYCDIVSSGGVIKRPHLGLTAITDWSKMPMPKYEKELPICQKFYWDSSFNITGIAGAFASKEFFSAGNMMVNIRFPVKMRTVPSVKIKSAVGTDDAVSIWAGPSAGTDVTGCTAHGATLSASGFNAISNASSAFDVSYVYAFHVIAIADLENV